MVRLARYARGKLGVGDLDLGFICRNGWVEEDVTGERGGRERGGAAAQPNSGGGLRRRGAPKWGRGLGIFLCCAYAAADGGREHSTSISIPWLKSRLSSSFLG
jgi:hypothetical protein